MAKVVAIQLLAMLLPSAAFAPSSSSLMASSLHRRVESLRLASTVAPTAAEPIVLPDEVDEVALLATSTFPIPPEDLIQKCKYVIRSQQTGLQDGSLDENLFADDFRFCAPFVGGRTPRPGQNDPMPGLPKNEYLKALRWVRITF